MKLPILYSFRRCPYAMRARLALMHCGAQCELREVLLKDKPAPMLEVSSKGTVPVLVLPTKDNSATATVADGLGGRNGTLPNYRVIDESIEIMHWAMKENHSRDLDNSKEWLITESISANETNTLIHQNDFEFKGHLDKYKYSDRHPEHPQAFYLEQAMPFLENLDGLLCHSPYLGGSQFRFADAAILPFVRQFSMVEPKQFNALPLPNLQKWLIEGIEGDLFESVMHKAPQWKGAADEKIVVFGKS